MIYLVYGLPVSSPGFCNRGVHFGMHRVLTSYFDVFCHPSHELSWSIIIENLPERGGTMGVALDNWGTLAK